MFQLEPSKSPVLITKNGHLQVLNKISSDARVQLRVMGFYYLKNKEKSAQDLAGHIETLNISDRWMADGLSATPPPGALCVIEIDMSQALQRFADIKSPKVSHFELVARAVAICFERHRNLYKMAVGYRRYYDPQINLAFSVMGDTFVGPLAVIRDANKKTAVEISKEILPLSMEARKNDAKLRTLLSRIGWILPFRFMRVWLQKFLFNQLNFRKQNVGAVQITSVPVVDIVLGQVYLATSLFAIGALRERVIAVNGQPVVRSTLWLSCTFDHSVWDGMCASIAMGEIKKILEKEAQIL